MGWRSKKDKAKGTTSSTCKSPPASADLRQSSLSVDERSTARFIEGTHLSLPLPAVLTGASVHAERDGRFELLNAGDITFDCVLAAMQLGIDILHGNRAFQALSLSGKTIFETFNEMDSEEAGRDLDEMDFHVMRYLQRISQNCPAIVIRHLDASCSRTHKGQWEGQKHYTFPPHHVGIIELNAGVVDPMRHVRLNTKANSRQRNSSQVVLSRHDGSMRRILTMLRPKTGTIR